MNLRLPHFLLALAVHALIIAFLFFSVQCSRPTVSAPPAIEAVLVKAPPSDKPSAPDENLTSTKQADALRQAEEARVQAEKEHDLEAQREAEQQQEEKTKQEQQQAQAAAEKQAQEQQAAEAKAAADKQAKLIAQQQAEQAELQAQQKAAAQKAQQEAQDKARKDAEQKAAEAAQKAAQQKQAQEKAEAEQKATADAKAKADAAAAAQKKADDARKKLADKAQADAEARRRAQQELAQSISQEMASDQKAAIQSAWLDTLETAIARAWTRPPNTDGNPTAVIHMQLSPSGAVITASIKTSSGNVLFDESVKSAVYKASPLPLPSDPSAFDPSISITFCPSPNAAGQCK